MTTTDESRRIGGRYRLVRSIGAGGMGTVWEGHDEVLHRDVAVKEVRFPSELGEREISDLRERTMREARATARLSHPNVVTTFDVVEEDDRPWIVMELLRTRSLAELLRDAGPLPPHRVAEVGLDVLGALEAAHAQGVVHRDVKPSNVLITPDGRAVLTDFGIATVAGDPALTSTGMVLGSPAYMSPERARGGEVGPGSDLWSLGATLFAAAEGRPPFDNESALGTLTAVISDPVPRVSAGGALAEAVSGLLEKDPARRASIPDTRDLLRRAAADRSATATTPIAEVAEPADRTRVVPAPVMHADHPSAPYDATRSPTDPGRRGGRGLMLVALVVGLLLIGVLVALALTRGDGDPGATPSPDKSSASSTPPSTSSSPPSSSAPATPDNGLPAGFQLYRDPSGFAVAVPDGWTPRQASKTAVDLVSPDGTSFLRVDQTDKPKEDPAADWERQEKDVSKRLDGYQRVTIESVDYRDWPAADWEFTFVENDATVHVRNRGFVPSDEQGYALYLSTPEEQWDGSQQIWQVATDTFQPASDGGDQGD